MVGLRNLLDFLGGFLARQINRNKISELWGIFFWHKGNLLQRLRCSSSLSSATYVFHGEHGAVQFWHCRDVTHTVPTNQHEHLVSYTLSLDKLKTLYGSTPQPVAQMRLDEHEFGLEESRGKMIHCVHWWRLFRCCCIYIFIGKMYCTSNHPRSPSFQCFLTQLEDLRGILCGASVLYRE